MEQSKTKDGLPTSSVSDIFPKGKKPDSPASFKELQKKSERWSEINSDECRKLRWWGHVIETSFVCSSIAIEKATGIAAKCKTRLGVSPVGPVLIAFAMVEFIVRAPSRVVPVPGLKEMALQHHELARKWNAFGIEAKSFVIQRVNVNDIDIDHFYDCGLALCNANDAKIPAMAQAPEDVGDPYQHILDAASTFD